MYFFRISKMLPLENGRVDTINCSNIFENIIIPVTYNLIIGKYKK